MERFTTDDGFEERILDAQTAAAERPIPEDDLVCLDDDEWCAGPIKYRTALSPTGRSFPRCERHWELRLVEQERIQRDYPDSPTPPAWFDETAAGERWDEEE